MDRERLAIENLRLAGFMAQRQKRRGSAYSIEELYSLALEGLWKAARTYQEGKAEFSTYACKCIEHCFIRQRAYDKRQKFTDMATVSIDAKLIYGEKDQCRLDKIPDPNKGPEEKAIENDLARQLRAAMAMLSAVEKSAVLLRYGIGDRQGKGMDWAEIGRRNNCTRQAAQQAGARGLKKMRAYLEGQRKAGAAL